MRKLITLLLFASPLASQTLVVVDDDGPADHATIAAALTAAPDGAVVLVRAGTYGASAAVVTGKSLTLVADAGASVDFTGENLTVQDLTGSQTFTMRGITLRSSFSEPALVIDGCEGAVFVDDCEIDMSFVPFHLDPVGIVARDSDSVVFSNCEIIGGAQLGGPGGTGMRLEDSTVHLFHCEVSGGLGRSAGLDQNGEPVPAEGGDAIELDGGFLFATLSTLQGGRGSLIGNVFGCPGGVSGDGGNGLLLQGASPNAELLEVALIGGLPGEIVGGPGGCLPGLAGEPSVVLNGSLASTPADERSLSFDAPVAPGAPVQLDFVGEPGDFVWYLVADGPAALFVPLLRGTLAIDLASFSSFAVGFLDGTGTASVAPNAPPLPVGAGAYRLVIQALFLDTLGDFTLGTPGALVVR